MDFLDEHKIRKPTNFFDVAFYLIHSMTSSTDKFDELETKAATNFNIYLNEIGVKQVVYLSGIVNQDTLSKHLTIQIKCRRNFI